MPHQPQNAVCHQDEELNKATICRISLFVRYLRPQFFSCSFTPIKAKMLVFTARTIQSSSRTNYKVCRLLHYVCARMERCRHVEHR